MNYILLSFFVIKLKNSITFQVKKYNNRFMVELIRSRIIILYFKIVYEQNINFFCTYISVILLQIV